jgi:hypothetical protein
LARRERERYLFETAGENFDCDRESERTSGQKERRRGEEEGKRTNRKRMLR